MTEVWLGKRVQMSVRETRVVEGWVEEEVVKSRAEKWRVSGVSLCSK